MAIFIKGKTTCRICGQVLASSEGMVGFPNTELHAELGELSDSCLHQRCLDTHTRRDELLQAWKLHWVAQAKQVGAEGVFNPRGVVIFNKRRFTFASLESFVELEDQIEVFAQLRAFFASFSRREPQSIATTWNTYELARGEVGMRLLVTANASPPSALRATPEGVICSYDFSDERLLSFSRGWAEFAPRFTSDRREFQESQMD